jgi:L-lactate dehydrogenase complex protein LldF
MLATSRNFKANAELGLANATLQRALAKAQTGFPLRRRLAVERLPEFEALREEGRAIKDHTLAHLDFYLELFEQRVIAAGGKVHWARTADEACAVILQICRAVGARTVTKGKSMVAEEIGLNEHLAANGIAAIETDLGEYIIQLRREPPSHIIAPAIHLVKEQIADTFRAEHRELPSERPLAEARQLCDEARKVLRPRFLAADVGITGANFLIAETGSSVIVTNEGNGDLTQTLPRVHIVLASLEKLVPTFEDAATLLRQPVRNSRPIRPSRPARGERAISTVPSSTTSCCSTTGAAPCWAASSRTCCAASAAPPVLIIARSMPRSAGTPMSGSIRGRWGRC